MEKQKRVKAKGGSKAGKEGELMLEKGAKRIKLREEGRKGKSKGKEGKRRKRDVGLEQGRSESERKKCRNE